MSSADDDLFRFKGEPRVWVDGKPVDVRSVRVDFDRSYTGGMGRKGVPDPQPVQLGLEGLSLAGFEYEMTYDDGAWTLWWGKGGARWKTTASSLPALGTLLMGWLNAREREDGPDEGLYAEELKP